MLDEELEQPVFVGGLEIPGGGEACQGRGFVDGTDTTTQLDLVWGGRVLVVVQREAAVRGEVSLLRRRVHEGQQPILHDRQVDRMDAG